MTLNQPVYEQLYDEMLQRIRTGAWPTGAKVPSERTLIAEFGASRAPVRQALAALRSNGMITSGRGAPPRVQRPVPSQSFDTFLSFTDWAKRAGFTPGQRVIETSRRPASEQVARELGVKVDEPVVEIVRLRTLDDEPAMLERSVFRMAIGSHMLDSDPPSGSIYQRLARLGIVPSHARYVIDAVAAHPLDAEWLRVAQGVPLLRARRVTTAADGTVIEYADDRHLPNMTTFAIENSTDQHAQLTRETVSTGRFSRTG